MDIFNFLFADGVGVGALIRQMADGPQSQEIFLMAITGICLLVQIIAIVRYIFEKMNRIEWGVTLTFDALYLIVSFHLVSMIGLPIMPILIAAAVMAFILLVGMSLEPPVV